jgi:hypothetical protein
MPHAHMFGEKKLTCSSFYHLLLQDHRFVGRFTPFLKRHGFDVPLEQWWLKHHFNEICRHL